MLEDAHEESEMSPSWSQSSPSFWYCDKKKKKKETHLLLELLFGYANVREEI